MQIKIAARNRPFSHTPGAMSLLPGSPYRVEVFPTLVRIADLSAAIPQPVAEIAFNVQGPVHGFTVNLDLERGDLHVWGDTPRGYIRYRLHALNKGIALTIEKHPEGGLEWSCSRSDFIQLGAERPLLPPGERLSLGSHKTQDWDLVRRREDLTEILPIWLRLGQLTPACSMAGELAGAAALLKVCEDVIAGGRPEFIETSFLNVFRAGFQGILSPRLIDDQHQGFGLAPVASTDSISPLLLLSRASQLIRDLFIRSSSEMIQVLPAVPPEFHCGRFLGIVLPGYGSLDMEWTKKAMRQMIFTCEADREVLLQFPRDLQRFRLRRSPKGRSELIQRDQPITIQSGAKYWLDRFEW